MSTDEEQVRYLEDATKVVREQAFYMKRAMVSFSVCAVLFTFIYKYAFVNIYRMVTL